MLDNEKNKKGIGFFALIVPLTFIIFIFTLLAVVFDDQEKVDDAKRYHDLIKQVDNSILKFETVNFFLKESIDREISDIGFKFFEYKQLEKYISRACKIDSLSVWFDENERENNKNCMIKKFENKQEEVADYIENQIQGNREKIGLVSVLKEIGLTTRVDTDYNEDLDIFVLKVIVRDEFFEKGVGSFEREEIYEKNINLKSEIEIIDFFSNENNLMNLKNSIFLNCDFNDLKVSCMNDVNFLTNDDLLEDYEINKAFYDVGLENSFGVLIEISSKILDDKYYQFLLIYSDPEV